ncbi:lipoyl synthase [Striga asiatica]|uniref:Lipoyl synthase n=1 Tax=Striga asiatica TaxID=4170 RepID=A0A5A7QDP5_STRAF|nr:lipoyl synthase [Striga asiatica]
MRSLSNTTKSSKKTRRTTKSSRKTRRSSVFPLLSVLNTTTFSRKTKSISVFKRLSYCTNPPANGDSKPIQSATTRRRDSTSNLMFLVRYMHGEELDYSVITFENNKNINSFRLLLDDDDDLPHNLLSVIRDENFYTFCQFLHYPVLGSCDSYIWGARRTTYSSI